MLERDVHVHPELGPWARRLFDAYKNEGSASRGIANIAPNLFIGARRLGYFHYGRHGKVVLVYAYTGPEEPFDELAGELLAHCDRRGYHLNFLSHRRLTNVGDVAFTATPFGVVQRISNLPSFTLKGGAMHRLRYQVRGFQKAGACAVEEYSCGFDPGVARDIVRVIDAWCAGKTKVNPLVRTARAQILEGTLHPRHRLFLTRMDGVLQNVVLISPLSDSDNGYLMDLEFYGPDMPRGGLEFAIVNIIEILVAEGRTLLSLGGTYGCRIESSPNADPAIDALLDDLHKQAIFNDQGNFQFKNKFRPENQAIYLCRRADDQQTGTVVDIIMMIADPARSQTSGTENHIATVVSEPVPEQAPAEAAPARVSMEQMPSTERLRALSGCAFNPMRLADDVVSFDLQTDSWAKVGLPAKTTRMRSLHAGIQQPVDVGAVLHEIFPFQEFVLTQSGRTAEQAFYRAFARRGVVVQNVVFPTNLAHQIASGFSPKECPLEGFAAVSHGSTDRGEVDLAMLEALLRDDPTKIAMVFVELANNAAGGASIAVTHLREVKTLLAAHGIPLVLDGTRILENVRLAQRAGYRAEEDPWLLVREWLAMADAAIFSLAKDFRIDRGGVVALRDRELKRAVQSAAAQEGVALDLLDRKLVALAIRERADLIARIDQRMEGVARLWEVLHRHDVPLVGPVGGHCVVVDARGLAPFGGLPQPAASFCAWLFLATGVRAGRHSVGMQRQAATRELVRLAIPVDLDTTTVDALAERLDGAFSRIVNVPCLQGDDAAKAGFGEAAASYRVDAFQAVDLGAWSSTDVIPPSDTDGAGARGVVVDTGAGDRAGTMSMPRTQDEFQPPPRGDIAIVGVAGRYPKAQNIRELWENLRQGRDCIEDLPDDRYERRLRYGPAKRYRGGFIDDVDRFDSLFFHISPKDAERLDPQERLFVEVAWEVLEDAGYDPEAIAQADGGNRVGVYVGAVWAMYQALGIEERHLGAERAPNSFLWGIANRVSYTMNFSGPSMTVDTACSSSLMALYLACEAIRSGECDSAIVGGVNLDLHQSKWDINWSGGALSKDGVCRSFGQGANGYVAGEGVGAIYIKPLDRAIADGDQVYGVVKGIAVNHGGRTSGFIVPNPKAQTQLVRAALERSRLTPADIGYIEAHGTGTELGDPLEISALNAAFCGAGLPPGSCAVGSLKSNIGHLEAAAGVASVTKVLLQMRYRQLVPSLHSAVLNEHIDFRDSPFRIQQVAKAWTSSTQDGVIQPLRAGVSSFGAGGANAHVVIESYDAPTIGAEDDKRDHVFPISARTEAQRINAARNLRDFIANYGQDVTLADIAYTLQVGRKPFEYRVAIVANSSAELLARLEIFLDDGKHASIVVGNGKNAGPMVRLMSRTERAEVVALLAGRANAAKLARLWADGMLFDWRGLPAASCGRRVSLPTYPFADKRYWVPESTAERRPGLALPALHPLLDSNESTFERQLFRKSFHADEFFIYDHKVMDVPTLPGVAYLELARKAGELAAGMPVRTLRNILWVSPIAVRGEPHEVRVELVPAADGVSFEVFSDAADGSRVLHSQGKITYASRATAESTEIRVDLASIKARCRKVAEGNEVYPRFRDLGLDLGPSFRSLREVYHGDGEALGLLRLPASRSGDLAELMLHPSLIDGALQAGVAAELAAGDARMLVPFSIGEVEILGAPGETCWTWVTEVIDERSARSAVSRKNVMLLDTEGNVLVRIREATGVPIGEVHKSAVDATDDQAIGTHSYVPRWEPAPGGTGAPDESVVLLVGADVALHDALAARHRGEVILVRPGDCFASVDAHAFEARLDDAEDLAQVFAALDTRRLDPSAVFLVGSTDTTEDVIPRVFGTCQALARRRFERKIRLLYAFDSPGEGVRPRDQSMVGLFRSLQLENAKIQGTVIELAADTCRAGALAEVLHAEWLAGTEDGAWVRYVDGERQVQRLTAMALPYEGTDGDGLPRPGGTYLITGGAGGLGLIFAEWLAETYQAKLVLSGRSPPSTALEERLETLRRHGADVVYVQADVSRREDVARLVAEARERFGAVHGVLHGAGVLRDAHLRNTTRADFDAVLAPKLDGTLYLDELTADEPLDFFAMCSSMAALGGNAGQTAYAYANHFMDSFASVRERMRAQGGRHGRTLSVNWSLWAEGGMRIDASTERMFLQTLGIAPIPTRAGVAAFAGALRSGATQVAVVEGIRDKIETAWGLRKRAKPAAAATAAAQGDLDRLEKLVRGELRRIAMDFLKLDEEDISTDSVLLELGFDSIGLTSYANAINGTYGVEITPVLFFDYPSIAEVASYLCRECAAHVAGVHDQAQAQPATETPSPAGTIAEPVFRKTGIAMPAAPLPAAQAGTGNRFRDMPIAIVGMSGVMPDSDDLDAFWKHLDNGDDLIRVIPRDRWNWEDYYGDPFKEANKSNSKWGGFMNEVDKFDPLFFGISRREAQMMDPQQRIFLETVWKAIEDSGHKVSDLAGTRTGLFVGVATNDYVDVMNRHDIDLDGYSASGNSHSVLANRISFLLNLRGPSAPIDTACSSSLVALHRAIESIHTGSCDMAIVGGVQVMLSPGAYISFGMAGMLSNDGRCKTFDKRADGYVRGEGSGAVLIKPLARAEADGDHIYAVVRATSENHGGRVTTLTAPNSMAQSELLVDAYTKADVDPSRVGYIECHGTGTGLGDPIEIQALKKAFGELYARHALPAPSAPHCGLSSAKTNIGHLETAAGIAGILRTLLAIRHRRVPANVHFEEINPYIDLSGSPFYIAQGTRDWVAPRGADGEAGPRLAGISSFGFGGANAHVVLEEYVPPAAAATPVREEVYPLSARDDERLRDYVQCMLDHLGEHVGIDIGRMAYTLQVGRDAMPARLAVTASDRETLMSAWRDFLEGREAGCAWHGVVTGERQADGQAEDDVLDATFAARAWVQGEDIDWAARYPDRPHRLPLPTYPFARERCWLPGVDGFRRESGSEATTVAPASAPAIAPRLSVSASTIAGDDGLLLACPVWRTLDGIAGDTYGGAREVLAVGVDGTTLQGTLNGATCSSLDVPIGQGAAHFYEMLAVACFERIKAWDAGPVLFQVVVESGFCALATGLVGMFRSMAHERPTSRAQVLVVPAGTDTAAIAAALEAAACHSEEALLRWDGQGTLQGRRWDTRDDMGQPAPPPFREHGVYLIAGGLGGLGRLFARHILARTRHARVVLGGRGALDGARQEILDALLALAPDRVSWLSLDLDDPLAVRRSIDELIARTGGLHGVIHAAGMTADNLVARKSLDEFRRVLAPKVAGTMYLDEVTRGLDLDFFVAFSSVVAALGNIGQADYSAANGFLEAYAASRREAGDTGWHAIGWSLWEDGGMQVPDAIRRSVEGATGMRTLSTEHGLNLFHRCLELGWEGCLVMQGNVAKMRKMLEGAPATSDAAGGRTDGSGHVSAEVTARLKADLLHLLSDTLLVPAGQIDAHRNLSEYGLDSIGVANFFRALHGTFGIDLPSSMIFEHPTLDALVNLLGGTHADHLHAHYGIAEASPVDETPSDASAARIGKMNVVGRSSESAAVAIVGMAGIFPGADDPDALWRNLVAGTDAITDLPAGRWNADDLAPSLRQGGFLASVDRFDAAFFGIGADEAALMDPQQRLFLQVAWRAIEHAGHRPSSFAGSTTGVFVGVGGFDYAEILRNAGLDRAVHAATGLAHCVLANRVSYHLDLRGPSEAIDTACSSSLVAVHRAAEAVARGECDQAIAGGVNLMLSPSLQVSLGEAGMLSGKGRCRTFDDGADGYVRGEGCAAVLLKRLDHAIRDGNDVLAVVKGSGVNHGGRAMSLTAPNPNAQAELLVDVYARAAVDPAAVGLIETHGTGTPLGDAVEINGLKKAVAELGARHGRRVEGMRCTLGALKTHIGHLEAASGIASLVVVILAIRHRTLPGVLHHERMNPQVRIDGAGLRIVRQPEPWQAATDTEGGSLPLTAGVSAFGFGGVNAHVIVQEYPADTVATDGSGTQGPLQRMIVLSARTSIQLDQRVQDLLACLRSPEGDKLALADVAYTLQVGRDAMEERLGLIVESRSQLEQALEAVASGTSVPAGICRARAERTSESIRLLDGDPDLKAMITAKWLAAGEIGPLLEFWTKGVDVDWDSLYADPRPRRVPLPTYPFAAERHWVDTMGTGQAPAAAETPVAMAVPEKAAGEALVRAELASQLDVEPQTLDADRNFFELGVSSLGLAQLVREVNDRMGLDLSPSMLFEYPTIRALAAHLDALQPVTANDVVIEIVQTAEAVTAADAETPRDPMALLDEVLWQGDSDEEEYERLTF